MESRSSVQVLVWSVDLHYHLSSAYLASSCQNLTFESRPSQVCDWLFEIEISEAEVAYWFRRDMKEYETHIKISNAYGS